MIVKDIMTSSIISAYPEDSLEHICFLMKSEDIGFIPVCDRQNHLLGIITDRDLIIRSGSGFCVGDLMTKSPITVSSEEDIHNAALYFSKHKIRRLPVVDNERLVGILSLKDMAKKKFLMAEIGHIIYNISKNG